MAQESSPSPFTSFFRWLRLKNYQYEVTFSLYMLTSTEKIIFNTLLITLTSMMVTAAYIYLPGHIVTICSHSWYYLFGESFSNSFNATLRGANGSGTTPLGAVTGSGLETMAVAAATARTIAEL